ncbi:hypothetical protein M0R72_15860 [Candidatus Pacearchaeota archaeon]|jgi:hypothetical protein|nr:hypothetical protein [Candidatus Pacearchaeota archaeon]
MVRLLILFLLLSLAAGSDMSLYVAGNATGIGSHNMSIDAPGANVTGNNTTWVIIWEDSQWQKV